VSAWSGAVTHDRDLSTSVHSSKAVDCFGLHMYHAGVLHVPRTRNQLLYVALCRTFHNILLYFSNETSICLDTIFPMRSTIWLCFSCIYGRVAHSVLHKAKGANRPRGQIVQGGKSSKGANRPREQIVQGGKSYVCEHKMVWANRRGRIVNGVNHQ